MSAKLFRLEFEERAGGSDAYLADESPLLGEMNLAADFRDFDELDRQWTIRRFGTLWRPRQLRSDAGLPNDFEQASGLLILSQKAVAVLHKDLKRCGELLPLARTGNAPRRYIANITSVFTRHSGDCYRITGMTPKDAPDPNDFSTLNALAMSPAFFCVPPSRSLLFVTQPVADEIANGSLTGVQLREVWRSEAPLESLSFLQSISSAPETNPAFANAPSMTVDESVLVGEESSAPSPVDVTSARLPETKEEIEALDSSRRNYRNKLGMPLFTENVHEAVAWVEARLAELRDRHESMDATRDGAFWLAIAWGECVVAECGWHWMILQSGASKTPGIVSSDEAYGVPVLQMFDRLAKSNGELTLQLLFNMIKEQQLPRSSQRSLHLIQ